MKNTVPVTAESVGVRKAFAVEAIRDAAQSVDPPTARKAPGTERP
jgi:hypothetical protein